MTIDNLMKIASGKKRPRNDNIIILP